MAPTKTTRPTIMNRVTTRSKLNTDAFGKRKADASPSRQSAPKRSALGDMTNAFKSRNVDEKSKQISKPVLRKVTVQSRVLPTVKTVAKPRVKENVVPAAPVHKVHTRLSSKAALQLPSETVQKSKEASKENVPANKPKTRLSNQFEKTAESSLYTSALEDIDSAQATIEKVPKVTRQNGEMSVTMVASQIEEHLNLGKCEVPEGVHDFDKENWNDVFQVSNYAMDIFKYLQSREPIFKPSDYMPRQPSINRWMRSLLVDWMVEIQESFELNHETLYMGVKLVDLYLSVKSVNKETLQLVGAASIFVASKYDERMPPLVEDFLYVCDGAYKRGELLAMERSVLKAVNFDLGIPLSYRFLRRFARTAKTTMPILTLARYILEYSLMDYSLTRVSDSQIAAAALYLALRMKQVSDWTPTLEYYTGYKLGDILSVVRLLNTNLMQRPREQVMTIRNKYSHKIFFEVAKIPLLKNEDLQG